MARKAFNRHEAVSAVVPGEGAYRAAIAVKHLEGGGAPQFHKVLEGQTFKTAHEADVAACEVLAQLADVDDDGQLHWQP
jgi:hypothetical protein